MNPGVLQLSLVFLVVGTLLLALVKKLKMVISANGKKGIFYLLAAIVVFAIGGILSAESLFAGNLVLNFSVTFMFFLLLGIVHLLAMESLLSWEEEVKGFAQPFFTFVTAMIGSIGFINAADYVGLPGFHLHFLSAALAFFIPLLFQGQWRMLVQFPVPVYQRWYYPVSRNISMPDSDELRNLRIISLEFEKVPNGSKTIFKAKAPESMNFGKFFYHFINDYNHRSPEAPIAYKDENNQVYGWAFYIKPNLIGATRSVNPELTITSNRLKEHTTIVCQRVSE